MQLTSVRIAFNLNYGEFIRANACTTCATAFTYQVTCTMKIHMLF